MNNTIQTPPPEVLGSPSGYPSDEDGNPTVKTIIARMQGTMLRKICPAIGGMMIECGKCNKLERITMLYKCRWCAVWYCHKCAAAHFGPDSEHSQDNS